MKRLLILPTIMLIFVLSQCSDNPVNEPPVPPSPPSVVFEDLIDELEEIAEIEDIEELKGKTFSGLRQSFQKNLETKPNDAISHLGLAILEILELNYNSKVWGIIDSLETWEDSFDDSPSPAPAERHNPLIGREFSLLVEVPFAMGINMASQFPGNVTAHGIQDIIKDDIIDALDRAITHLDIVEAQPSVSITVVVEDDGILEDVVIDLGEIFLFSASVHALRAAFNIMIAYDVDMYGPDGTYDWLDDMRALDEDDYWGDCSDLELHVISGPDSVTLTRDDGPEDAQRDSILVTVAHHNLTHIDRTAFLTLRDGGASLAEAQTDLDNVMDKLYASANAIRNRVGESEYNVIKLADLEDLDADLLDPDAPNFTDGFTQVEQVIDFVDSLLTGPMDFDEDLGDLGTPYQWTMDLSRFFNGQISDWKAYLPYHQWNVPTGNWIAQQTRLSWEDDYSLYGGWFDGWFGENCDYMSFTDIGWVRSYYVEYKVVNKDEIIQFLDAPSGNVIDLDVERFPYMPDYTLNGMFPGQTRQDWLDLVNILDD